MIKKINDKNFINKDNVALYSIIFFFGLIFLSSILIKFKIIDLEQFSYVFYYGGTLLLIAYIYLLVVNKYLDIFDYLFYILIFLGIISTIFAMIPKVSLIGADNRYEGLFALCIYYLVALIARNIKDKKSLNLLIKIILFIGFVNVLFGLYDFYKCNYIKLTRSCGGYYGKGLVGNSDFLSSLMIICFFISFALVSQKSNLKNIITFIIFVIGIIISGAMSGFITIAFIFICLIIYELIKLIRKKPNNFKTILLITIICSLTYYGTTYLIHPLKEDTSSIIKDTSDIASNNINEYTGSRRLFIWKNTLKASKDNLLNGVGIDNFSYAFYGGPLYLAPEIYDKAHNEYLQILITEGLPCLLVYLSLLFIVFYKNIKLLNNPKDIYYPLYLAFIGYLIQAFFNISITRVAPFMYLLMGLLIGNIKHKKNIG